MHVCLGVHLPLHLNCHIGVGSKHAHVLGEDKLNWRVSPSCRQIILKHAATQTSQNPLHENMEKGGVLLERGESEGDLSANPK